MNIAINGLGRIGRRLTRFIFDNKKLNLVAINDIMPIEKAVYLLKYDSTYETTPLNISVDGNYLLIEGQKILYTCESLIEKLPWKNIAIDVAINCSGTNKSKPQLSQYLDLGIEKVILSSPPDTEDIPIVIRGYNTSLYRSHSILSNASCTTYCVAPILDILHRNFSIRYANFTTIHCYTSDQNLQDAYHSDFRRARAAGVNIIPTTTSATRVIKAVFPELKQKIMGSSFRVPVINGSITEFIVDVEQNINLTTILDIFKKEIEHRYQDVIGITEDKIVSSDAIGCKLAALVDVNSIEVVGNTLKLTAFYDNESGYSYQLLQLVLANNN